MSTIGRLIEHIYSLFCIFGSEIRLPSLTSHEVRAGGQEFQVFRLRLALYNLVLALVLQRTCTSVFLDVSLGVGENRAHGVSNVTVTASHTTT